VNRGEQMEELSKVLFELLLVSDGRTTDMLESLCGERVYVEVINQEKHANTIYRESFLYTVNRDLFVSHNFMMLYPEHVPSEFYQRILEKEEVIGKILKNDEVQSNRIITKNGWCLPTEISDLSGNPKKLIFDEDLNGGLIPFKEYKLHFQSNENPGIKLVEYFNPNLIHYRLQKNRFLKSTVDEITAEKVGGLV
jgi:hypothetical protein